MTTLTIPYTLENDDGAIATGYKPEASVSMESVVELFNDAEVADIEDDEIIEVLLECVRDDFVGNVSPVVGQTTLETLVKQVREALEHRDSTRAPTHGA